VIVEVVSIVWYTAAGPNLVFAFDARVRWWVAVVGFFVFGFVGIVLTTVTADLMRISEDLLLVLNLLIFGVILTSELLWLMGLLSTTGIMGCYVMLLTGTLPAVLYAFRKN